MLINRVWLRNWHNFAKVDVELRKRQFIFGPDASDGPSLLEVFRFLHQIAKTTGGGLQAAVAHQGGLSRIRRAQVRRDREVGMGISLARSTRQERPLWRYELGIKQEPRGFRLPYVTYERVWKGNRLLLNRPNAQDLEDHQRRYQTCLEQVNSNREFREIVDFFRRVSYPRLAALREKYSGTTPAHIPKGEAPDRFDTAEPLNLGIPTHPVDSPEPFRLTGQFDPFNSASSFEYAFLERIAEAPSRTRQSRLGEISQIVATALPDFSDIRFERDKKTHRPHLSAQFSHWREGPSRKRHDQFPKGTLRLLALLWQLLEGDAPFLLDEPELSLPEAISKHLAPMLRRAQGHRYRQVLVNTQNNELLSHASIGASEVLLLTPTSAGTRVSVAADQEALEALLEAEASAGEVASNRQTGIGQLRLF